MVFNTAILYMSLKTKPYSVPLEYLKITSSVLQTTISTQQSKEIDQQSHLGFQE